MNKTWLAAALLSASTAFAADIGAQMKKGVNEGAQKVEGATAAKLPPSIVKMFEDKLGKDWKVGEEGNHLVATRQTTKPPEGNAEQKVQSEVSDLIKDNKGISATHTGGEVTVKGQGQDCSKLADGLGKIGKIGGVNKILIEARCALK